jgi:arylsulfatase A-like enzyme
LARYSAIPYSRNGSPGWKQASTSSYTLPAHASMLSGQLPSRHGVESERAGRSLLWLDRTELLAARLRDAGWQTAAFTGGVFLSAKFGFAQGFDRYDASDLALERRAPRYDHAPVLGQPAFNRAWRKRHALGHALDWIRGHSDGPYFLFLHTYLVHEYLPAARTRRALPRRRARARSPTRTSASCATAARRRRRARRTSTTASTSTTRR